MKKTAGGNRENHTEGFSDFRGDGGVQKLAFVWHLLVVGGSLQGNLGELWGQSKDNF